ncbi:MAG: N-6 DNA methylase [Thermoproteota archaeon]
MNLEEFARQLKRYVNSLLGERNEATRADRFRDFIRKTFPEVEVGSVRGYYPELEKYLKWVGVGQVVKGRADSLFGSLVLEFESILDESHEEEAKKQLRRYISIIWSIQAERGQPYERLTAIATDGLSFIVFKPRSLVSKGPITIEKILLEEIDRVNISKLNPEDAYTWLKRYIITAAIELRPVDPDEFARRFGIGSEVFNDAFKILKKGWDKAKEESATLYEQWEAHLRIVYGVAVGSEELYIRHTYLATLAKLIVYSAYSGGALPLSREELSQILDGSIFRKWRIINFIEEDLFSWVHKVEEGLEASLLLSSSLAHYDLTTVTLDVFKEVYQGLVDPEARHELGEYYTPDWLAEMIVGDVLGNNPYRSVLDPACGSGTFLAAAIAFKKQRIKDLKPAELLVHILENVVGMDVHPLAVMISRATYLITLGRELLEYREQDIVIPVYLSDSLRLPEVVGSTYGSEKIYTIKADGLTLGLPARVAENPTIADATVDALRDYAKEISSGTEDDFDYFKSFMTSRVPSLVGFDPEAVFRPLHRTAQNIMTLIKKKRDTIWGFILKNYYRPIFINKKKVDAIIGNPPWLSYRYVKSTEYQRFLKQLIVEKYGLFHQRKLS